MNTISPVTIVVGTCKKSIGAGLYQLSICVIMQQVVAVCCTHSALENGWSLQMSAGFHNIWDMSAPW